MTMKKYHSHTLLYLHETIELGSGDRYRMSVREERSPRCSATCTSR